MFQTFLGFALAGLILIWLARIQKQLGDLMAELKTFQDLLNAINTETNRIAAAIDKFIADRTANGGMTADEESQAVAGLQAASDRLKTIATDPADPIPAITRRF